MHVIGSATEDGIVGLVTCKSQLGGDEEEGVDDIERREASLVTSAMLGSAISDRCTVT